MNGLKLSFFAILSLVIFSSCEKDDPTPPNEEELITTLNFAVTASGNSESATMSFTDLDGDGGNAPIIINGELKANTTYNCEITLLNEQENPSENITLEVEEEAEEHQFFFSSTVAGLNIAYTDQDANGNPIGIMTQLTTGTAGSGQLTITLRHEPTKTADGVSAGDITNAGGETDIQVTFNVDVN